MSIEHHEGKYSALIHTLDPWAGSKGHFCFFTESGNVAYQIKEKEE